MCEKNPDFRVGRYETRDKGGTAIGHWTKVLALGRPGVHGGARAGIALLPASRGPRSRVTLAFLWGRGAASFAGRKRPQPQPQHTRREGRSNLYVPHKRPGSGRTRTASPDSAARSASSLRLERPSNDEAASPKENVAVTTSCWTEKQRYDDTQKPEGYKRRRFVISCMVPWTDMNLANSEVTILGSPRHNLQTKTYWSELKGSFFDKWFEPTRDA